MILTEHLEICFSFKIIVYGVFFDLLVPARPNVGRKDGLAEEQSRTWYIDSIWREGRTRIGPPS